MLDFVPERISKVNILPEEKMRIKNLGDPNPNEVKPSARVRHAKEFHLKVKEYEYTAALPNSC